MPRVKPRLLIIDDERALLASLRACLTQYEVTCVADGSQALLLLTSGATFDAVLCDLHLPGVTGLEIHRTLEAVSSPMVGRFIWMTGGLETLVGPTLIKPFTLPELEAALESLLARARTEPWLAGAKD